jgi:hypothetical protein
MKAKGYFEEKKNDYAVLCPVCFERHRQKGDHGYKKLKLWVEKDYGYGHCFRCNTVFVPEDQSVSFGIKRVESPVDMSNWKLCKLSDDGFWTLDRFNTFDEDDEQGVDYLAKKRLYIYRQMYKSLGIRFKDHNPVIPFYYKGDLIYYQIRMINDTDRKYHSPSIEHKPPYVLEHGDNKKFVICEGVFDAIACRVMYPDRTPFAVLGSDITPYQIAILRSYCPEDILIYMDKTDLSESIRTTIAKYINYADFDIVKSNGQDPEECLKERLMQII